jgi:hypothetical protein
MASEPHAVGWRRRPGDPYRAAASVLHREMRWWFRKEDTSWIKVPHDTLIQSAGYELVEPGFLEGVSVVGMVVKADLDQGARHAG